MATTDVSSELLLARAKLYRPRSPQQLVERPRLIDKFEGYRERLVTLVTAPAGYGKSTAISQWIDELAGPWGWLSLDSYDNDVSTLVEYMVAAIQLTHPDFGQTTQSTLASPTAVPPTVLADALVNDLLEIREDYVLVLDDVHLLEHEEPLAFLKRLIAYMPYNIHLVLSGRVRPALSWTRLQLHGQLSEISAADLAFEGDEIRSFLSLVARQPVGEAMVALLDERTEGWAAGLQLGGLALRVRNEEELLAEIRSHGNQAIAEYLIDEVVDVIPRPVRDFMLRTSILDRLNPELCGFMTSDLETDSSTAIAEAKTMLERIERSQLFLLPLDAERGWYRYHQLLQETLQRTARDMYGEEWLRDAHRQAAIWFRDRGIVTEAIKHASAAGDAVAAAELVEANYHRLLDREERALLGRWIRLVPTAASDRPFMLMARAWSEHLSFRLKLAANLASEAAAAARQSDSLSPEERERVEVETALLQLQLDYHISAPVFVEDATTIYTTIPDSHRFAKGLAALMVVFILNKFERVDDALMFAQDSLANAPAADATAMRVMLSQCAVYLCNGRLTALRETAEMYLMAAKEAGHRVSEGWGQTILGYIAYQRNELADAEEWFTKVVDKRFEVQGKAASDAFAGLCLTQLARGRFSDARRTHQQYGAYLLQSGNLAFVSIRNAIAQMIRLTALMAGQEEMQDLNTTAWQETPMLQLGMFVNPTLVTVRQIIFEGDKAELTRAQHLLDGVESLIVAQNEPGWLSELRTLRAIVCDQLGDRATALNLLRNSVSRSRRERAIRSIVDCGPKVQPLLAALRDEGFETDYIDLLLTVLHEQIVQHPETESPIERYHLTNRELDVLLGLLRRMTNKEIASELYLSPLTVKRHAQNLYRKLGAANRREAVAIAQRYGLFQQ